MATAPSPKPSVCFVALNAYALLSGRDDVMHIGGAEVQQVLVARELARRGYEVRFVTRDHDQIDGDTINGIAVFKACSANAGLPGLRFIHPRWSSLWGAMYRANADVYYQRNGGVETGQVAMWARLYGRRFIFAAAADTDCQRHTPHLPDRRSRMLYRYGLRRAHQVITQTEWQRQQLRVDFGLSSQVISSCTEDPGPPPAQRSQEESPPRVLWLGRFTEQKNLHLLLDVATMCPELAFDLVGNQHAATHYAAAIRERASSLENVHLLGWVPHKDVAGLYRRACVVLCTSSFEGFPNTFLEAWARAVPVVTTVDPDGVVEGQGLGLVAGRADQLAACLRQIASTPSLRAKLGTNARELFLRRHTISACTTGYERVLQDLVRAQPTLGPANEVG